MPYKFFEEDDGRVSLLALFDKSRKSVSNCEKANQYHAYQANVDTTTPISTKSIKTMYNMSLSVPTNPNEYAIPYATAMTNFASEEGGCCHQLARTHHRSNWTYWPDL